MDIHFNTYYTYAQLTERLAWLAGQHPGIMQVTALGKTYEGREIPLIVLTNTATGPDTEKPAFWLDANIHATELTASMAALYFVKKLAEGYGSDPKITRILDEQVVYVVPRLNPDGAELALADKPKYIRSGTRPYPLEDKQDGLHPEDIDGDGRILQMRIPDPTGDWKVSDRDPRLMVKRGPDEEGGAYYRLFPEGLIENYDGHMITVAPALQGLDFNRNFPGAWRPEGEQRGAGDYPGSEPEIHAVIEFMAKHSNVYAAMTFHTYSRAILRPFGTKSDDEMDVNDKWVFEAIGERGTAITNYPCVSVYHHFRYHPKEVITGVFDDWLFEHKGVFAVTVELWDLATAAGVEEKSKEKKFMDWFRKHPVEDDYKIVEYADKVAPGGLVPWYAFDHSQLGKVELGGWNTLYTWRNPPHALLEAEIAPQADFALAFAALAPRIAWREVTLTPLGEARYHLLAVVENRGFLPTNGSQQALKMKAARPVRLELELPAGASLVSGKPKQEIGHLEGRSNKLEVGYYEASPTDNRGKAEWLIHAPAGGALALRAIAERGGTIHRHIEFD
ncbi:MAG: M14 family metallopeptidase [Chloroflexi bacterium]|nr:M14 family metallopeptidase [Chloroflexota bacterium]